MSKSFQQNVYFLNLKNLNINEKASSYDLFIYYLYTVYGMVSYLTCVLYEEEFYFCNQDFLDLPELPVSLALPDLLDLPAPLAVPVLTALQVVKDVQALPDSQELLASQDSQG